MRSSCIGLSVEPGELWERRAGVALRDLSYEGGARGDDAALDEWRYSTEDSACSGYGIMAGVVRVSRLC